MIAIIPAAGLGKRMASITEGQPKELLPLGRQTVLERIVDEAVRAGADEVVVVSSPQKPQIEAALREWSAGRFRETPLRVVYQHEPRGWADAVFAAGTDDDVLVMLGDCVYHGGSPSERMATLVYRGVDGCIAVEAVPDEKVRQYGICEVDEMGGIRKILEKPSPEETTGRWAAAARYAFTAPTLAYLRDVAAKRLTGEDLPMTPLMQMAIDSGVDLKAVALQPGQVRVDCGTPEEYQAARRLPWD